MLLLLVQGLFDGRVIQAMCWTLLHSLWQGLVLAIVGGVVIMLTRKSAPAIRYNCLSALFFLFFLSAMLTFGLQLHSPAPPVNAEPLVLSTAYPSGVVDRSTGSLTAASATGSGFINGLVSYFNEHALLVVAIWFIIFSARLVRVLAHLGTIQRMRHYRTHAPSEYWGERLQELALALKMRMSVVLLESEIVRVPMVVGFFKPVILVPFSLLSQLPPEQVEAILLHELAHIRRRDYFVNLIQSFTEILFFFNPGVLWISSLIREERENCCDDIAVGQVKSKKEFIHALVNFQEYNNAGLRSAIAFAGSRDHLLQRVKRIIYRDNKILDIREKFFLLACLVITGALTLAFSYTPQAAGPVHAPVGKTGAIIPKTATLAEGRQEGQNVLQAVVPANDANRADTAKPKGLDSVPDAARREKLRHEREQLDLQQKKLFDEQQRLSEQQDRLIEEEMKLSGDDGALIMEKKKVELQLMEMKMRMMAEKRQMEDEDHQRKMTEEDKRIMEKKVNELQERARNMEEHWKQMSESERRMMEMKLRAEEEERKRAMEDMEKNMKQSEAVHDQKEEMMEDSRRNLEDSRKRMDENSRRMEENKERMKAEMEKRREEIREHQQEFHEKSMATVTPILEFLATEKLITDKDNVSFSLTADGLVVNGKKQPDALFRQARDKYLKDRGDKIVYSKKGSSESFSINRQ